MSTPQRKTREEMMAMAKDSNKPEVTKVLMANKCLCESKGITAIQEMQKNGIDQGGSKAGASRGVGQQGRGHKYAKKAILLG